jgi:hypothetical protein
MTALPWPTGRLCRINRRATHIIGPSIMPFIRFAACNVSPGVSCVESNGGMTLTPQLPEPTFFCATVSICDALPCVPLFSRRLFNDRASYICFTFDVNSPGIFGSFTLNLRCDMHEPWLLSVLSIYWLCINAVQILHQSRRLEHHRQHETAYLPKEGFWKLGRKATMWGALSF